MVRWIDAAAAADECRGAVVLGVDQAVIGLVRLREHGIAGRVLLSTGNRPQSTMMPPSVVPWPPMNFVNEWITMSAPYSTGRTSIGVATVLSTISGMRWRCATRRQRLEVADVAGRIADGLAKYRAGVLVDQRLEIGGAVGLGEAHAESPIFGRICANNV